MIFTPRIVLFGATFLGQSTPTIITMIIAMQHNPQIGRASCRERVSPRV